NLQAIVVSPKGERQTVHVEQTAPGHYETHFPTKEVGAYLVNLMDVKDGQVRGSQVLGASVNYSPEFTDPEPNFNLLRRVAESGGGKVLDPAHTIVNPFQHDRKKTFQPRDLWEWLLKFAVVLFTFDVAVRLIQLDRDEWQKATRTLRRWLFFWNVPPRPAKAEESLAALLARRDVVRSKQTAPALEPDPELFRPERAATTPLPGVEAQPAAPEPASVAASAPPKPPGEPEPTKTSRLLAAKRRAQKRGE